VSTKEVTEIGPRVVSAGGARAGLIYSPFVCRIFALFLPHPPTTHTNAHIMSFMHLVREEVPDR
jgi:hypothetical protein